MKNILVKTEIIIFFSFLTNSTNVAWDKIIYTQNHSGFLPLDNASNKIIKKRHNNIQLQGEADETIVKDRSMLLLCILFDVFGGLFDIFGINICCGFFDIGLF
jgi:hypothetical protein